MMQPAEVTMTETTHGAVRTGADFYSEPSFSFRNRLARACWAAAYVALFRYSPLALYGFRAALLRMFGARVGAGTRIYPSARVWAPWNLRLGNKVVIGPRCNLYSMARTTIDAYAVVSQGAHLCAGSHDINSPNFRLISAPIHIGAGCWIAAESFVGMGVRTAPGVVVGARAVVMKDCPEPCKVWAGNPARQIGTRQFQPAWSGATAAGPGTPRR